MVPFLALLNPLLGTNFPISSAIKNLNPELKGIQFQEIVLEIIKKHLASMDSEIVLIFEDYHWVDQSSCALFNKMIKLISEYKVLLILTSRPIQEYSYLKPVYECLQSFEHFNVNLIIFILFYLHYFLKKAFNFRGNEERRNY